jgi:hypothetical protein
VASIGDRHCGAGEAPGRHCRCELRRSEHHSEPATLAGTVISTAASGSLEEGPAEHAPGTVDASTGRQLGFLPLLRDGGGRRVAALLKAPKGFATCPRRHPLARFNAADRGNRLPEELGADLRYCKEDGDGVKTVVVCMRRQRIRTGAGVCVICTK